MNHGEQMVHAEVKRRSRDLQKALARAVAVMRSTARLANGQFGPAFEMSQQLEAEAGRAEAILLEVQR